MSLSFGTIQLALIAAFCFAAAVSAASALLYPVIRRPLHKLPPAARSKILFLWCIAPALASLLLTALAFLPSLPALTGIPLGSWYIHTGEHMRLSLADPSGPVTGVLPWAIVIVFAAAWAGVIVAQAVNMVRAGRLLRTLTAASRYDSRHGIRIVNSRVPFAFACGLGNSCIFVSTKVLDSLSREQLAVVLAHERAHLSCHYILREYIARTISFLHLPWVRKWLLMELSVAQEQVCDEDAASRVGDRLRVADTILTVERLFKSLSLPVSVPAASFAGSNVTARVESLLSEQSRRCMPGYLLILLAAAMLIMAFFSIIPLHNQTELLLGFLTG